MIPSPSAVRDAGDLGALQDILHRVTRHAALARAGRVGLRMLATVALIGGSLAFAGVVDTTPAFAADVACDGVTVVVDFTDIGGEIEVGCAEGAQDSGRAALLAAGFTATDSLPGFLCAIDSMPDPCPEVFDGSFWSYWHTTAAGEWESYQVGADSSTPSTGEIDGWRYNDGTTPPGMAPAEVAGALPTPAPEPTATETPSAAGPGSDKAVNSGALSDQQAAQNTVLTVVTVSFLALVAALILIFIVRRRRNGHGSGGAGAGSGGSGGSGSSD